MAHHQVTVTGELGGSWGLLAGLLDAVMVAGFPMACENLAPLPAIMREASAMVTDAGAVRPPGHRWVRRRRRAGFAAAIARLLGPEAAYVTGAVLRVEGGM